MSRSRTGLISALIAYILWGVLPVYWKALQTVSAPQILSHRILWSFFFLAGLVLVRREGLRFIKEAASRPRIVLLYVLAAILLSINWLTYIWAVNAGRIVETSLGYFINPLVSVILGLVVLRESFHRLQWVAAGLAASGVVYLTIRQGNVPWVALVLAFSFGFYGLMKKMAPLGALHGLTLETAVLVIPALIYLAPAEMHGTVGLVHSAWTVKWLLIGTGFITALPLLLFASAARAINLSTLGLLQYVSPTCGLVLGVWVYGEPFPIARLIGFCLIWSALVVLWLDLALRSRCAAR
jgi:chloramphenicol-sensitive protein RarD